MPRSLPGPSYLLSVLDKPRFCCFFPAQEFFCYFPPSRQSHSSFYHVATTATSSSLGWTQQILLCSSLPKRLPEKSSPQQFPAHIPSPVCLLTANLSSAQGSAVTSHCSPHAAIPAPKTSTNSLQGERCTGSPKAAPKHKTPSQEAPSPHGYKILRAGTGRMLRAPGS